VSTIEPKKPCRVMDLDRFGNRCTQHGWDVTRECHESERDQVPAPPRPSDPGQFLVAL
jgi:hypothetical protein